jgi:radical SAM superfamily enzyme YgiQ (UPF0313 family)
VFIAMAKAKDDTDPGCMPPPAGCLPQKLRSPKNAGFNPAGWSQPFLHNQTLPDNIENIPPDYDLYPELGDRAIGFLTRGCPFRCAFCIVPAKEGRPRQVSDLDTLLAGRRKLILLDDNILSHPKAVDLLEEIASRNI